MSTVREHLGLLWLLRHKLQTKNPNYDPHWEVQAALFSAVHLDELIALAGGADIEGTMREHFPEVPADFPHSIQHPASPAPASVQDRQGGLTEDTILETVMMFRRAGEDTPFGAETAQRCARVIFGKVQSAILARQAAPRPAHETIVQHGDELVCTACGNTAPTVGSVPEADDDELRRGVRQMAEALAADELAEHVSNDPDLLDLEEQITALVVKSRAPQEQAASRAAVPEGFVLMPKALTAENGAKAALSGEFRETIQADCPACCGDGEDCNECGGTGTLPHSVPVGWSNIKAIYARAVELLAAAPAAQKGKAVDGVQWWLAELDRYGNAKLVDGAHSDRAGADKAAFLFDNLGLTDGRKLAVARVEISEPRPSSEGVNMDAVRACNQARVAVAQQHTPSAHKPCTMRMSQGADVVEVTGRGDGQQDSGQKITDPLCAEFNCLLHAEPGKKLCCNHEQDSGQKGGAA